jgi:hypothetical protein
MVLEWSGALHNWSATELERPQTPPSWGRFFWKVKNQGAHSALVPWRATYFVWIAAKRANAYCGIDWLFLPQRRGLIHTVSAPLNFKFVDLSSASLLQMQ